MNLLRPWRWFRAAIIELTGVAACLLLIGFSHAERTHQLNMPPSVNRDASRSARHEGDGTQLRDEELWQFLGVALEKVLR